MKSIRIYGCSDAIPRKNLIRSAAVYFLRELLPRKRKIDIKISVQSIAETEAALGECYNLGSSKYWIRLDAAQSDEEIVSTLAHEVVHVKQFDRGELQFLSYASKWKGVLYDHDQFECHDEPWEIEARDLEQSLTTKYYANHGS